MARSTYIYLIHNKNRTHPRVLGAFTVKWEAHEWAENCGIHISHLELSRYRDGIAWGVDKKAVVIPWEF